MYNCRQERIIETPRARRACEGTPYRITRREYARMFDLSWRESGELIAKVAYLRGALEIVRLLSARV